jgi:exosortase
MSEEFTRLYQIVFFFTFGLLIVLERFRSLQRGSNAISGRWTTNIGLLIIVGVVGALALPIATHSFAHAPEHGLLAHREIPVSLLVPITVLLLDLWRYWEHRLFHSVPMLWRLHLVHHSDTQLDVTTAERHHPLEAIPSMVLMTALVLLFGLSAVGVGVYVLAATVVSFCSHANLCLPESYDRILRRLIVTPTFHAVHHSALRAETNANYGLVFSFWDRIFGSFIDPERAKIPYFGLEYFHRKSDSGLIRALLQPFLYRTNMAYLDREAAPQDLASSTSTLSEPWKGALLGGLAGCVLAAMVLWPTAVHVVTVWTSTEAYQYAWLVIPMAAYLLAREHRNRMLALDPQPGLGGVVLAATGAGLWSLAALMNLDAGRHLALVLIVHGVALAMVGWRLYRKLFPILCLLFFAIPSGDVLQPILRTATVKCIEMFAYIAGLPYNVDGFVIFIGTHRYIVVDACSGLSYVTLASFLSYSFGLLLYRSLLKIVALTLLGAGFGLLANAVRVNSIILIDWFRNSQADLSAHGGMQWMALLLTLGLLFLTLCYLEPDRDQPGSVAAVSEQKKKRFQPLAPFFAGVVVVVIIGGTSAMTTTHASNTSRPKYSLKPPENLVGWTPSVPRVRWLRDDQHDTQSLHVAFRRNGRDVDILILEGGAPNTKLPTPRVVPNDSRPWHDGHTRKETVCLHSHCRPFLHTTWQSKGQDPRHVYYNFRIGGFETASQLSLRAAQGWHQLTGSGERPRLIAFTFSEPGPDLEVLVAALSSFEPLPN